MGSVQSSTLNEDADHRATSGSYGDLGEGTSDWFNYIRVLNGGIVALGATDDVAASTGDGSVVALLKALRGFFQLEDAAASSGSYGLPSLAVRNDTLATLTSATGDYSIAGVGQAGEQFATPTPPLGASQAAGVGLSNAQTTALATNLVIKASAGTLYGLSGFNNNGAVQYLQLANLAALGADATIPVWSYPIAAGAGFHIDFGVYGRYFSTGIVACISSTLATKTIGGADLWLTARYK